MAVSGLNKSFKCFEIQTQIAYLRKMSVTTPDNDTLFGIDALRYNLEHNENVVSVVGGEHTLDYKSVVGGEFVEPHIHYYVKLKDSRKLSSILGYINGCTVSEKTYIAPDLDNPDSLPVGSSQIENLHSTFSKCYDYLLHRDEKSRANPLKHLYTEDEVHLWLCGTSIEEVEADTNKANGTSSNSNRVETWWDTYGELLETGVLKRWNYALNKTLVPHVDFVEYGYLFEKYFNRMDEIKLQEFKQEEYEMEVLYLYGDSRCGKTSYAKYFAKDVQKMDYFMSGSSNDPFDGYLGQPVIILDDLRGSCLLFSDLLKILDPYNRTKVKSRYYNKIALCRYIIITSVVPIDELYSFYQEDKFKEPLKQLKARCKDMIHFTTDKIEFFRWSDKISNYHHVSDMPNFIVAKYRLESEQSELDTPEKQQDYMMRMLGEAALGLLDTVEYYNANKEELLKQSEYGSALEEGKTYNRAVLQAEYSKYRELELKAGTSDDCIKSFVQWLKEHNYILLK